MKQAYYFCLNFLLKFCSWTFILPYFWKFWYVFWAVLLFLFRYRKKIIEKNLEIAFGDKVSFIKKRIWRYKVYFFISYEICYFFRLQRMHPQKLNRLTKVFASEETLNLCKKSVPLILLSGHTLGVWIGILFSSYFRPSFTYTYHGPEKGSYEIFNLFERITKNFPFQVISQGKGDTFKMLRCLKQKHCLSIVGDLNAHKTNTYVSFFGKTASFSEGAFRLALKTKTPIIFGYLEESPQKKLLFHLKQIYYPNEKKQPSVLELARIYSKELEKAICKNPCHYFWSNKRWKNLPEDKNEVSY